MMESRRPVWIFYQNKYIGGRVVKQEKEQVHVVTQENVNLTVDIKKVFDMNPEKFHLAKDLSLLSHLNEPSILHNLKMRYEHDLIYTNSGLFLVAMNPYKEIRELYDTKMMERYNGSRMKRMLQGAEEIKSKQINNCIDEADSVSDCSIKVSLVEGKEFETYKNAVLGSKKRVSFAEKVQELDESSKYSTAQIYYETDEPHIFKIANDAYTTMMNNNEDQSILITGESGAGKTENTKKVISFLAHIAGTNENLFKHIRGKILETNTTLEAFGNAQTIKNDNSSRFGKFIKIIFSGGEIIGAHIENYLLERSRITRINKSERSYHVFYYLIEAIRRFSEECMNNEENTWKDHKTGKDKKNSRSDSLNSNSSNGSTNNKTVESEGSLAGRGKRRSSSNSQFFNSFSSVFSNINSQEYRVFLEKVKNECLFEDGISVKDFEYLKNTNFSSNGEEESYNFFRLCKSLDILEFTEIEKLSLFKILATVLFLGNLKFSERNDQASIINVDVAEKVCYLLKIPIDQFLNTLLHPTIKAGNEDVVNSRTKEQVINIIEALARLLYERMFDTVVDKINTVLNKKKTETSTNFIGVLDIAGFEIYQKNDFEQLCINYTNEKLQQFFNHHMFILEQEIYRRENISWDYIDFGLDLQPTIDLIEKNNPIGILSYLDEECVMPKGSDKTFLQKLREIEKQKVITGIKGVESNIQNKLHRFENKNRPNRTSDIYRTPTESSSGSGVNISRKGVQDVIFGISRLQPGFFINHYAGKVEYIVDGWLKKNKDPFFEYLNELLKKSTDSYVQAIFSNKCIGKKGFFRSVSQKHKDSLCLLMEQLRKTTPFFVRCILPNTEKKINKFDDELILNQLKCNGVMEGIRISRQGFPTRMTFKEFRKRYRVLKKNNVMDNKEACIEILKDIDLILQLKFKERSGNINVSNNNSANDDNISSNGNINSRKLDMTSNADKRIFQKNNASTIKNASQNNTTTLYKIGNSMIFFKQGVLADIEDLRDVYVSYVANGMYSRIQKVLETRNQQVENLREKAIVILQKNARISIEFRNWHWWKLYQKIKPLLKIRKHEEEIKSKDECINKISDKLKDEIRLSQKKDADIRKLELEKNGLENEINNLRVNISQKEELLDGLRNEIIIVKKEKTKDNAELEKRYEKEIEEIKEEFNKKIEAVENGHKKEILKKSRENESKMAAMEEKHRESKQKLLEKYNNKAVSLEKKHKNQIENLCKEKDIEIDEIKKQNDKIIKELNDKIKAESEKLLSQKNSDLKDLNSQLNKKIDALRKENEKEIENIKRNHKEEIKSIINQHQSNIDTTNKENESKIIENKKLYEDKIKVISDNYLKEKSVAKTEIDTMKSSLKKLSKDKIALENELKLRTEDLNKKIKDMQVLKKKLKHYVRKIKKLTF
ncbi:hypothetical protein EDEG_03199 [Edhazardia aedis USNM 41457]|uniref:Myosin motor domain-containing protein n=1 Tax=Edhazardia aedis (strain USNM 41457) TaxID=1003232 RepID=J8ZRP6_EDHAE|nr:hypothetical protein EDEG_03199 [Edhazardia aedis USNM 41457]|eukprot:EJW02368.1 hypothetical protein EDEG_03199 [Edhazardia aedis USNM 41457]